MAELTRPFPPGEYPVIIVGSGPGALQTSYSLRRLGVDHAVLSADPSPGGMFRRWPHFQRLLSWTKPHAPVPRSSRTYERYDWNSLLADEPDARALQPDLMDGTSYFPSRPEMEANLASFADRAGLQIRYGCTWTGTARDDAAGETGPRFTVETSDGSYRCRVLVVAVGVAEPFTPPGSGMEYTHHYAQVRAAESYAGRRVLILGKQNSGFELANGLLQWARQLILMSPSHAKLSVDTRTLVGVRARYVQPFEDHVLGGGVAILDAAMDRIEPGDGTLVAHIKRTDGGGDLDLEVDDVISATGFVCPLVDLADLGVATFGASRLPVQTPWWESTVPGIRFAGTIGQGAKGLQRHGVPANSGAVHGARYNARVLAGDIAAREFGIVPDRPRIAPDRVVDAIVDDLSGSPELFHQRGYLAHVLATDPAGGFVDEGVQPLAHVLDADGPDALAITMEADGTGAIYPVLFTRIKGMATDHTLDPDPFLRYDTPEARRAVESVVARLAPGA